MKRSQEQLRPPQSQRKDAEASVKITIKCLEAWSLERTVLVADGEPAIHALMIAAKLARHKETVVTGMIQRACGERIPGGAGVDENFDENLGGVG